MAGSHVAIGQSAGIQPEAEQLLRSSTGFLARQQKFAVDARSTIEVVLASGQKLRFDRAARMPVRRPDGIQYDQRGAVHDRALFQGNNLACVDQQP